MNIDINMRMQNFFRRVYNNKYTFLFSVLILTLLLYRITLHADSFDEIINVNVAYRISLGDIPFYQCWEAFQNGDMFLAPFLWIYVKIVNSTGGIVLFSRFFYFLCNCALGFLVYKSFKRILGNKKAYYIGLLVPFIQLYSLYYLWYDTSSTLLLAGGTLFTFNALGREKTDSHNIQLVCAGVCHALMTFAYPTMLIVALSETLIIFIYSYKLTTLKKALINVLYYCLGAVIIIFSFILFVIFYIGIENFTFGLNKILSYRGISSTDGNFMIYEIVRSFLIVNKFIIFPMIFLFILYIICLLKRKYKFILISFLILISFINQFFINDDYQGLANFVAIIALWAPLLLLLINNRKRSHIALFWLVWIPCILSSISISISTVYAVIGPVKCWQSFLGAFLVSLFYINVIFEENEYKGRGNAIIITMICVNLILLGNFYSYIYLKQPYIKFTDKRITSGIFRGIKVNDYMSNYVCVQAALNYHKGDAKTILAGMGIRPIYLMTDLRPFTPSVETPDYYINDELKWDMTIEYFDKFNNLPDLMVLQEMDLDNKDIKKIIEGNYSLISNEVCGEISFTIYRKNK